MAHIAEALHEITRLVAEGPGTTTAKGFAFERLIKQALKTHPGEYGPHRFEEVWLWSEWPGNEGEHDHGIDLVARQTERYGGGLCAIQCKFYDPDGTVSYTDVTKFLAASESGFTDRIFVATCQIAANGEKVIAKAQPPCQVLMATDMDDWVDDWRLFVEHPELLELTAVKHEPRPDQLEALDKIEHGLTEADRGKLILPCGTGKSVVALWTAERLVGAGGRVVYFVPSLALMGQTMREWARHRRIDHSYLGVCSDQTVGRKRDDPYGGDLFELAMRVTTNREALKQGLVQASLADDMQVVFCTYQSAPVLAEALDGSDIHFDLMICDEAHRTTGIQNSRAAADGDSASGFHMVHDDSRIPARKRLYMTATPRVFTEQLKQKAERLSDEIGRDVDSFSMDDEATYGNDLYKMTFSDAIDRHLLTDYELLVIAVSDSEISDALRQKALVGNFETNDVVRLMGCWDALADPETEGPTPSDGKNRTTGRINRGGLYAKTAIAFSNTVKSSKQVREWWSRVVEEQIPASESSDDYLTLSVQHIDGSTPASQRATQISALRDAARNNEGRCRILSNARVLTEGVDVPALDAVIFLENRKSKIDITQAVGRVMRRAPDKEIGYVIVPVVVPEDRRITDKQVLDGSDFKVVWDVVRALRSHDERVDYWVNNLAAVKEGRSKIRILDRSGKPPSDETETVDLDEAVQLRMRLDDKIASKIVDMAGDRRFWPTWGERAAQVCEGIHDRLREAVEAVPTVSSALDQFVSAMQTAVGPQVTRESATEMIAQHVVTIPVFDHIFEESQFAAENPVSKEIERVLGVLREEHITFDHLTANLARSYRQMHRAFEGAESPAEKVDILRQIYEGFFQSAMKDTVKRLGIVYTPVQLVDFILRSADAVCRQEFGYGLTDEGVHVLDPFAGTGTFLYRLLTMKDADGERLIRDEDLQRKYRDEMHANEIVLLAYYIAALKIEAGMAERGGFPNDEYEDFRQIALTDSFLPTPPEIKPQLPGLEENSQRVFQQANAPIEVIVTNPPWSAGMKEAGDTTAPLQYPHIEHRVRQTYGKQRVMGKGGGKALGNLYIQAMRWMSDRVSDPKRELRGKVIAFVHPNSLANASSLAVARAALRHEFDAIYVVNLRGNAYTSGEDFQREGDKVFGGGSRNGVQITLLVKDPARKNNEPAAVYYAEIPDGQSLTQKFGWLANIGDVTNKHSFENIPYTDRHDWVDRTDGTFESLLPICREGGPNSQQPAVKGTHALGVATNLDTYVYSFSREELSTRVRRLISAFNEALDTGVVNDTDQTEIKWTGRLRQTLKGGQYLQFDETRIRVAMYRPFTKLWLYEDDRILSSVKTVAAMFPRDQRSIITGRDGTGRDGTGRDGTGHHNHRSLEPDDLRDAGNFPASGPPRAWTRHRSPSLYQAEAILITPPPTTPFSTLATTHMPDLASIKGSMQTRAVPRRRPSS